MTRAAIHADVLFFSTKGIDFETYWSVRVAGPIRN